MEGSGFDIFIRARIMIREVTPEAGPLPVTRTSKGRRLALPPSPLMVPPPVTFGAGGLWGGGSQRRQMEIVPEAIPPRPSVTWKYEGCRGPK